MSRRPCKLEAWGLAAMAPIAAGWEPGDEPDLRTAGLPRWGGRRGRAGFDLAARW